MWRGGGGLNASSETAFSSSSLTFVRSIWTGTDCSLNAEHENNNEFQIINNVILPVSVS